MNSEISIYLDKFDEKTKERFHTLYELINESTSEHIVEKMWAKLPSFYVGKKFIRIIIFKDHINIEANAILNYRNKLSSYKLTPKGMLQIFHNQQIPQQLLRVIFKETLD